MADSFFGIDITLSNLNDDEGGGGPSEDEYDALNDETFGEADTFDWELEHEQLAGQLESSRRHNSGIDDSANSQLEASLSQLVLDEIDAPNSRSAFGSNVWRHDAPFTSTRTPVSALKNVCTVEEIERQLRQKQQPQQNFGNQNMFFQPRFPPVILQRPPGLQAPVPLPFAPQQMNHGINQQMGQNNPMGPNNTLPQNTMQNHMGQNINHMGQNVNQFMQNANQMGQKPIQMGQNPNQMGQNHNQMGQNPNQIGQNVNQFMQNANQMGQFQSGIMGQMQQNMANSHQMGHNMNQMQNFNQLGHNQMGQNVNQMGQNSPMGQNNPLGQNMGQMMNGNQFGQGMNQFQHNMMSQHRMIAPPPGMSMPRQNFSPNMGQFNPGFRPQSITKPNDIHPMKSQHQNQPILSPPKNKQARQTDKQVQKTRVYNNKNMTSQNLVQLIQNTHPMLQFNNMQNMNHHPMLNRFSNQMPVHPVFERNGVFNNNRQLTNGDEPHDTDEYAGLMSNREKQWLINIQMLQLSTGTPYIHDFYYTVFLERKASQEKEGIKEAHKANQQNHPFYSGGTKQENHRERHNSNRHNSTSEEAPPRAYVPTQFENSLGKLQCGSVTAPRKIIEVELVGGEAASARSSRAPSRASTNNPLEMPRELKRTKQLLLDIESLYLILLRLEELNDPLAISNALILKEREEKQKQVEAAMREALDSQEEESNVFLRNIESVQRRPRQDSPKTELNDKRQVVNLAVSQKPAPTKNLLDEDKDDIINRLFAGLLHADRLGQILTVRKGRRLVSRFVSRVPPTHPRLRALWARTLRSLATVARRTDHTLQTLATPYALYIHNTTGWSGVLESCSLLAESFDPARTPYALTTAFTLSCVCALIEKSLNLVNTPDATPNERQWSKFLKTLARALKNTTLTVAKPLKPISEAKLLHHLKVLESRSTIEILQRGRPAEFADISKADVQEQLVKYLC